VDPKIIASFTFLRFTGLDEGIKEMPWKG